MRTYFYKLTSDRGGAPCAPPPRGRAEPLLTLAICKPAIRRTAEVGDRLIGLTSRALELKDGYPAASVIYAATVSAVVDARDYYAERSRYRQRPDCIYTYADATDELLHTGVTLHADPAHIAKDVGRHPMYRNGRVLLCREFRYFGRDAIVIPDRLDAVRILALTLGQGHRNVDAKSDLRLQAQTAALCTSLLRRSTRYTPDEVAGDDYDHAPVSCRVHDTRNGRQESSKGAKE